MPKVTKIPQIVFLLWTSFIRQNKIDILRIDIKGAE